MKSSSLYFVSACTAYGARIVRTERNDGRVTFELSDCPTKVVVQGADQKVEWELVSSFEDMFLLFSSGRLYFPPTFTESIQSCKALIYNDR